MLQDNPGRQPDQIIPRFMPRVSLTVFRSFISAITMLTGNIPQRASRSNSSSKKALYRGRSNIVSAIVPERYFYFLAAGDVMAMPMIR